MAEKGRGVGVGLVPLLLQSLETARSKECFSSCNMLISLRVSWGRDSSGICSLFISSAPNLPKLDYYNYRVEVDETNIDTRLVERKLSKCMCKSSSY